MVKYPCSTWPKPLEGNIQFLAILNAKVALGNFTSVDQCFEKSLNPLSHLTSWETWEVGGNKHTETEKLSGCQVGRDWLQRVNFGGVRDLVCMWIVVTQTLGICENSELCINRMNFTLRKAKTNKNLIAHGNKLTSNIIEMCQIRKQKQTNKLTTQKVSVY